MQTFASYMRHLRPLALSASLVFGLSACCSPSHAQSPSAQVQDELLERVRTQLSGYEHVPSASDWASLGEPAHVAAALMQIADEGDLMGVRAVSSLGHFPLPEVERFLLARVRGEKTADAERPDWQRGKAAIALGMAFGDTQAAELSKLLTEPSEALREDALRAFRHLRSVEVERLLEQRVAQEPSAHLKTVLGETAQLVAQRRKDEQARGVLPQRALQVKGLKDPGPVRKGH